MAPAEIPRLTEEDIRQSAARIAKAADDLAAVVRAEVPKLAAEIERLKRGLALAWSDGWQAAFDRPTDAEAAIKFRDLKHFRDVQAIIDGTTVD